MNVKWLIEEDVKWVIYDDSLQSLIHEITKQGMIVKTVKNNIYKKLDYNIFDNDDCVVFYGSLNLARKLQKQKGWVPGVYCNFKNLYCNIYYSYWAKYLLNKNYIMLPMMDILRQKEHIFNNFGVEESIFIRPNSAAKTFTGQLVKYDRLEKEFELFANYAEMDLDQIIAVISSPKKIFAEWRCIVVEKKVIAFSQYRKDDLLKLKREINIDAFYFAEEIAKTDWQPDRAYTLDICKSDDKYYLLEANSFSCSGLYEAETEPIVREVSRIALEEWKEYNG